MKINRKFEQRCLDKDFNNENKQKRSKANDTRGTTRVNSAPISFFTHASTMGCSFLVSSSFFSVLVSFVLLMVSIAGVT